MRIVKNYKNYRDIQVGFIGVTKAGEVGAFALQKGFSYALYQHGENKVYTSDSYL
jgi:isoaspartyl peptidase/L-asparaginase-like protein (Ntn-hydrolase superfamily)